MVPLTKRQAETIQATLAMMDEHLCLGDENDMYQEEIASAQQMLTLCLAGIEFTKEDE